MPVADFLVKTFAREVFKHLGFLKDEYGFAEPEIRSGSARGTAVAVTYRRPGLAIEASLVSWSGGEDYVATRLFTDVPDGPMRRTEIGHDTARRGHEMRKALEEQAERVRAWARTLGRPGGDR